MFHSSLSRAAILLASCILAATGGDATAACTLTTQWQWDGATRSPAYPVPLSLPLVVQLSDDNGDGIVGQGDVPDVVFLHSQASTESVITAVDGRDGSELFTTSAPTLIPGAIAAGDLDGDGVVELVAIRSDLGGMVAFRHDGSIAWSVPIDSAQLQDSLGIADLDQDGSPEIYVGGAVYSASGVLVRRRTGGAGRLVLNGPGINAAVDLRPDSPGLELVAGNTCTAPDGRVLWERSDIADGLAAVGDLDGDGLAEVVIATDNSRTELHVLDRFGASLAPTLFPASVGFVSPPTLADLDRDGRREVIVPTGQTLNAYKWSGVGLDPYWSSPANDVSCCGGITVFDLDADGAVEVLYRGGPAFYILDGQTGATLHEQPSLSVTLLELPIVADIDDDGLPEIVVTGGDIAGAGAVTAYECGVPLPARCIWNEQGYHVTNVDDDGGIPRVEATPWSLGLGWLEQEALACCVSGTPLLPDVTICAGDSATLDASSLGDPGCPGGTGFAWRDALGNIVGTGPRLLVSPATSTTYAVTIDCPGQPSCSSTTTSTVRVTVDLPPLFSVLRARELDPCNLGIELTWDAATFRDPSGTGSYNIYRSETSCLDAMTRPPIATGLSALRWVDVAPTAGQSYFYVVQAEDARTTTPCPQGPNNGGAVNAGLVCVGPILESPDAYTPELLGWMLRTIHVSDVVSMHWPGSRALLPGEHYHVLKSYDGTAFTMVNLEGALSTSWTETDLSAPLQFFDVRIANACEIQSLDDEPPGWDAPHP